MTSNPRIFQRAIGSGDAYDEEIAEIGRQDREARMTY